MMPRPLPALLLVLVSCCALYGQVPSPTPAPPPVSGDVVRISTNLIQVDVTVTDSKGRVITDLKPEEIEIYENGEKQKISNFSFISSVRQAAQRPRPDPNNPLPPVPVTIKPEQVGRTIALVVDDLSLSFESAYHTQRALKKFVDEQMQDGDLVAIIRTGAGVGALQQFTTDRRILYAAIERVRWNPLGTGQIGAFAPIQPPKSDREDDEDGKDTVDPEEALEDFRTQVFATGTLGALRYVVTGMSELPGRKSVILFSDGIYLYEKAGNGAKIGSRIIDFMRRLIDLANRSSVVFYAVDARGLVVTAPGAADDLSGRTAAQMAEAVSERSAQLFDSQEGLRFLAAGTGGFAVVNNNDLSGGVKRVLEDQSYYLIGYEPDSDTFDPVRRRFNNLSVKVLRPGLRVRYRSGFFNVATKEARAAAPASALTPSQRLMNAITSPFALNGITLRLNSLFLSDEKRNPFVRSLLHVDAGDLKFEDLPNGQKKATFDLMAVTFGDNGQVVDQYGKTFELTLPPERYKLVVEKGFVYNFVFPVKKPGAYQYRVAIRDGDKVGSASQFIDVPDLKKGRLTMSDIGIEAFSRAEWDRTATPDAGRAQTDPMADTARRQLKAGSVLHYGFDVYNAKLDKAGQPNVTVKIRVIRDGKVMLDGEPKKLDRGQNAMGILKAAGAVQLGTIAGGDYMLQIIVIDELAKKERKVISKYIQFEVVP